MFATVPSVTTAMRLKKQLSRKGIDIEIAQTPHMLSVGGCSYCIKFEKEHLEAVKNAVNDINSRITGLYNDRGEKL